MCRALLTVAGLLCLCFSLQAADPQDAAKEPKDAAKLAGTWRCETDLRVATYVFAPNGTFSAELREGKNAAKFSGKWALTGDTIEYTYYEGNTKTVVDHDRLVSVDDSSFTIEEADGNQRTYWRVKE